MMSVLGMMLAALTCTSPTSAQGRTDLATIDIAAKIGRPVGELVEATLGVGGEPRYAFEMLQDGVHVAVLDMEQLGQMRCPTPDNDVSGSPVLIRNGIVAAQLSTTPRTFLTSGRPEIQSSYTITRSGRIVPAHNDATARDIPAQLPLAAGLDAAIAGVADLNTRATGQHRITCVDYSRARGSAEGAVQSAVIAPFILFRPAENQSRENAQIRGAELYDAITLGAPLPADLEARAREARVSVRTHVGDTAYQVVTLDLGGRATNGVAQPRSVGYVGVRDGIVQWKAIDAFGNTLSDILCVSAEGLRGRVRAGCSGTGFYFP